MDDRELDARIAELVMGLPREDIHRRTMVRSDLPHYSTDIAAAFQVVEAMAARGLRLSLDHWGGDPWWAEFADEGWEHGGQATSGTAPRAICLAALEALKDTGTSYTTGGKRPQAV